MVLTVVWVVLAAAVVVACVASLFLRRHGEADVPAGDWRRTGEVFIDPSTDRRMRVWVDPRDGGRRYVPEEDGSRRHRPG